MEMQVMISNWELVGLRRPTPPFVTSLKTNLQSIALTYLVVSGRLLRSVSQMWQTKSFSLGCCCGLVGNVVITICMPAPLQPCTGRHGSFWPRPLPHTSPLQPSASPPGVSHTVSYCWVLNLPCADLAPFHLALCLSHILSLSRSVSLALALSLRENSSQLSEGERGSVTEVES